MASRLRARRRRHTLRVWTGVATAMAAAAAAAFVIVQRSGHTVPAAVEAAVEPVATAGAVAHDVSGGVLALSSGRATPMVEGMALETGDHLLTLLDGHVTLALPTGTHLAVEGGGDVAILSQGPTQLFELASGALRADVAKLRPGQRFVIRTSDAEVEVHGTSFRVAAVAADPACGKGVKTRVRVYEGVVTVRTSGAEPVALRPGESWPAACEATVPSEAPPAPPSSEHAAATPPKTRATPSDLTAQNDLFEAAMQFERRGDLGAAALAFERLVQRFPDSPLTESAVLERMRVLARYDHAHAVEAAREYMRRYPVGFGRAEAQAIAE
jgi:hypothetical protein